MAQFFPSLEQVDNLNVQPEPGKLHLLNFLNTILDGSYKVYFNPFLNGERPDIVILRQSCGVLIIEVKDWHLCNYTMDNTGRWQLRIENVCKKSPIDQVKSYKENLFNLHIDKLLDRKIHDSKYFAIISCAVYFHNETEASVRNFCGNTGYIELLGHDSLTNANFKQLLYRNWLDGSRQSRYFDEELYLSFQRYLQPPAHTIEQGKEVVFVGKQVNLIESRPVEQKIRGVAGSGKTTVLAKRAVNAHVRTRSRILILTYNISLRNYIHDKVSDVRENFTWDDFYIMHYHLFFLIEANNYNLFVNMNLDLDDSNSDFNNEYFFERVKNEVERYDSIFIDEIQDYKTEWIRLVKRYFLKGNGEFVVFGDEKQNVYQRDMAEDKKPNTTIPGRWNELNDSIRSSTKIIHLSFEFQDFYFEEKYDLDEINLVEQLDLFRQPQHIEYVFKESYDLCQIYKSVRTAVKTLNIHPNDVIFLSSKVEILRELDYLIRIEGNENTTTTFETREQWDKLCKSMNESELKMTIKKIRRNRKFQFRINSGTTKLSTIHSFKGWEVHTLILLIESELKDDMFTTDELIYTAITRCKQNLIVVNLGNKRYHEFFQKHIVEKAA